MGMYYAYVFCVVLRRICASFAISQGAVKHLEELLFRVNSESEQIRRLNPCKLQKKKNNITHESMKFTDCTTRRISERNLNRDRSECLIHAS
jgi:hypothetical protein